MQRDKQHEAWFAKVQCIRDRDEGQHMSGKDIAETMKEIVEINKKSTEKPGSMPDPGLDSAVRSVD